MTEPNRDRRSFLKFGTGLVIGAAAVLRNPAAALALQVDKARDKALELKKLFPERRFGTADGRTFSALPCADEWYDVDDDRITPRNDKTVEEI